MDRQQAIEEVRSSWQMLYPEDRKHKGIICPLCGSGNGHNGTGITGDKNHGKPNSLKCWNCNFTGDVIDLIQQERGLDFNGALKAAADDLGIVIDAYSRISPFEDFKSADDEKHAPSSKNATEGKKEPITEAVADYRDYYKECSANLSNQKAVSYLSARGISLETAAAFTIGFDAKWQSPTVVKNQIAKGNSWRPEPTERIIIPITKNHYIARAIDPSIKEFAKMNETGGGKADIFNLAALYTGAEAVFIVEGVFDALSIVEVGGAALAINSTSNIDLLLKALEKRPTDATLILSLDNDEPGQRAENALKDGLKRLNVSYCTADITGSFKDTNEALTGDKKAFTEAIKKAQAQTAAKPDSVAAYIDNLMQADIERLKDAAEKKTGFNKLDELSGGLYPGLYVIAATSSLGKTTFSHQIADNLAASGSDVLFFSMEQSRLELVSKSIARITAQNDYQSAVTSLQIRKGFNNEAVKAAAEQYKKSIADRLSIVEGNFNCNISFIGDYIRRYIKQNGCKPVVVIDYLQILQPAEDNKKATIKETVDSTVTELKRISRENDLTVFIISSVNRANYLTPIDFESLKESGGIEYTADVIWGLQLQCLNEPLFSEANKIKEKRQRIRQEKAANPRKIELLCLKNRYGISNYSCGFDYYPAMDLFIQTVAGEFNPYYGENPFEDTTPPKQTRI